MFNRKLEKKAAIKNLKSDYLCFVITCLLAAYLGSMYTASLTGIQSTKVQSIAGSVAGEAYKTDTLTADSVLTDLIMGDVQKSQENADTITKDNKANDINVGEFQISYTKGALSGVINTISSGQLLIIIYQAIVSITSSASIARGIFIALTAIVVLAVTIFIRDSFKVVLSRIFLEGQNYDHVKVSRFMFLFRVNRFVKSSLTMFILDIYQLLWDLTIIGGIIKRYDYFMVRYIIAENPDIDRRDAIKLSHDMMMGHKMELFKLEFSFIGWWILGACTFGLSAIFFSNPYEEATFTSFYCYVRKLAKENNIKNAELLNDKYLYELADAEELKKAYAHAEEYLSQESEIKDYLRSHTGNFLSRKMGIILKNTPEEEKFNECLEKRDKINEYRYILAFKQYPGRLFPMPMDRRNNRLEQVHYLRRYSIWTLICMFFCFAFIGWSWEVMLHLVNDGVFVNRGTMFGPWLPIYGWGGLLIIVALYRFRDRPSLEATLAIALCGTVEYFTHLLLEIMYNTKWWDYSGYFLNIGGRICAEGLLVFMLGGMAIVYALAPVIDNFVRKQNQKIVKIICIILVLCFASDMVYSLAHPNTGKGITDYDQQEVTSE